MNWTEASPRQSSHQCSRLNLMQGQLWLGVAISAVMLALMRYERMPVALIAVVLGITVGQILVLRRRCRAWISDSISLPDGAKLARDRARAPRTPCCRKSR